MVSKTKYLADLLLWVVATPIAFWLRVDERLLVFVRELLVLSLLSIPLKAAAVWSFHLHRQFWRKIGVRDLIALGQAVAAVTVLQFLYAVISQRFGLNTPRSVPLIEGMFSLLLLGGVRMLFRFSQERAGRRRVRGEPRKVLIVGAGEAGTMIAREMLRHPEAGMRPIGYVDDDPAKQRQRMLGLPVCGKISDLPRVAANFGVDRVLIAIPSAPGDTVRRVVDLARQAEVQYEIIPAIYDLLSGRVSISQIREVDVTDLLRREPVRLDTNEIAGYLRGRVVLVTGAGGSIGGEIVRQIARYAPDRLILLGRGENSIYQIDRELADEWPELPRTPVIADVRDREKLQHVFSVHRPEVAFHAAAHKHVPMMEANPDEAILNNVVGTANMAELALEYGLERLVNVSTDKAVNPTSIMGASKRIAEYVVQLASTKAAPDQSFVSVRFGNVLGSRGSVIPLFKRQIQQRGPVTVTHPDMQRYFMTIPEAAQLVLQAGGMGDNGQVYVLDMGEPVKIVDLAADLIRLSGFEPGEDIEIVFTGARPGEKLYEELLTAEEGTETSRHEKIFVARKHGLPEADFRQQLDALAAAARACDASRIREVVQWIVPTYRPEGVQPSTTDAEI